MLLKKGLRFYITREVELLIGSQFLLRENNSSIGVVKSYKINVSSIQSYEMNILTFLPWL